MRSACALIVGGVAMSMIVAAQQREPIRVATRLVQVNVVVQDRDRNPVSDLTKDDFRVTDDRKEQTIEVFSVESESATRLVEDSAAMPNSFSNRVATAAVSVILIDKLNTRIEDQLAVREQAIKFVQELKPSDRIGLYVLDETDNIRVLHDFSSDSSSLLRALARFRGRTSNTVATTEDVVDTSVSDENLDPVLLAWLQGVDRQREADLVRDRAAHTSYGFQTIARHLAGVRGRKNLDLDLLRLPHHRREQLRHPVTVASDLNPGLRALNEANVAMYPVDARRLIGAFAGRAADKVQTFTTLSSTGANVDVMELVADETGGRAYLQHERLDRLDAARDR